MMMSDPIAVSEKASWCMNHFDELFDLIDPVQLGQAILPNLTQIGIDKLYDVLIEADRESLYPTSPALKEHFSYGGTK
jgi:hypothetical protein